MPEERPQPDNVELEAIVQQNQQTNEALSSIDQNTEANTVATMQTTEAVRDLETPLETIALNTRPKEVQKIELVERSDDDDPSFNENEAGKALWSMLRGPKGYTPKKGVDYYTEAERSEFEALLKAYISETIPKVGTDFYTDAEIAEVADQIFERVPKPKNGKTPRAGVDYPTASQLHDTIRTMFEENRPRNGEDADPAKVAAILKADRSFLASVEGKPGNPGKSPDAKAIRLKVKAEVEKDLEPQIRRIVSSKTYSVGELEGMAGATPGQVPTKQADGSWKPATPSDGGGDGLPDQTGQSGKFLTTDGTDASWGTPAGSGDMQAATYDPQNIEADAFDVDNHTNGITNKVFTATEQTKLSGIEDGAEVNTINAGDGLSALDSTAASKLSGIEDGATSDQSGAEIVAAINAQLGSDDWQESGGGSDDQTASEVPFTPAGDIEATNVQDAIEELDSHKVSSSDLAAVATSGDYDDLSNKPSIPSALGDLSGDLDDIAAGSTNIHFTTTDESKLDGIEDGAQVNTIDAGDGLAALDNAAASKLSAIEANADVTDATNVGAAGAFMKSVDDLDDITDGTTYKRMSATEQSKLSGIEENADVTDATNVAAAGAVMESDTSTASMSFVVDEDDMASNSATKVPTQQSVKAYVDANTDGTITVEEDGETPVTSVDHITFKGATVTDLTDGEVEVEIDTVAGDTITDLDAMTTPADDDAMVIVDDPGGTPETQKISWANIKAGLKSYFDTLYQAAGTYLTPSSSNTVTNKRVQPRTASSTSNANLTPDLSTANVYYRTTQTAGLTINAPTGTPVIGEVIAIYVDSAGAQTLTMNATYIPFGAAFPASTTAGKTLMITAQYNGTNWKTLWAVAI